MSETKNNTNLNGHKVTANVIMFILKHDTISVADLVHRFKLSSEAADNVIKTMSTARIIGEMDNDTGLYPVIVKCLNDINDGIIEFLTDNGFTKQDIVDAFKTLTTEEKDEVSMILNEKRNWVDANTTKPDENLPVVVRMVNKNMIYTENRSEVLYAEDIKIAEWDGEEWMILPPYPKYDYSPISKFSELNEGTVVTHWAEATANEFEDWKTRFNRFNDYDMKIEIDPEHEEDVYRALMWGAAYIAKFGGPDFVNAEPGTGLRKMYETLCDIQACIDSRHEVTETPNFILQTVDYIVENAVFAANNGVYIFKWDDLRECIIGNIITEDEFNDYFADIVKELSSRDEVIDVYVNYINRAFDCMLNPKYCPHYEWQEGDEDIFGCSKEEWEKMDALPVTKKARLEDNEEGGLN